LPLAFMAVAAAAFVGVLLLAVGGSNDTEVPNPDDVPAADRPARGDHWHAAIGFYVCDGFVGPFPDAKQDALGIHSHRDGLIHIHPFVEEGAGANATLDKFMDQIGAALSASRLDLPGEPERENGGTCDGQPARVRVVTWDSVGDATPTAVTGNPADLRLRNGQLITVAFVPDGVEIPKPESAPGLGDPGDL
jgi:hypothetical protein